MLFFLIISSSPDFLNHKRISLCSRKSVPEDTIIPFSYDQNADDQSKYDERLKEYDRLFNLVNETIQKNDPVHNRFIGIIDCRDRNNRDVLSGWGIHSLSRIPGMMILSFPEIQWLPAYDDKNKIDGHLGSSTMDLDTAIELCLGGYTPLFDGDGLRGILLSRARRGLDQIDIRRDVVFSIDEEPHFAYMNTYTAFRFGYRGFPVMTARCAERLLKLPENRQPSEKNDKDQFGSTPVNADELRKRIPCAIESYYGNPNSGEPSRPLVNSVVVFEDICLSFPDKSSNYEKKIIPFGFKRDREYPMIADADLRVIATAPPRNERVAEVGEKHKVTLDQYFGKYCFNYRSVSCHSRKWTKQIGYWIKKNYNIFCNRFFNRTGGWWGYGLINALVMGLTIFTLSFLFLTQHFLLFCLNLLLVYLWFSSRKRISMLIIQHMTRHVSPGRSFFFKRLQWPFMPKYLLHFIQPHIVSESGGSQFPLLGRSTQTSCRHLRFPQYLRIAQRNWISRDLQQFGHQKVLSQCDQKRSLFGRNGGRTGANRRSCIPRDFVGYCDEADPPGGTNEKHDRRCGRCGPRRRPGRCRHGIA